MLLASCLVWCSITIDTCCWLRCITGNMFTANQLTRSAEGLIENGLYLQNKAGCGFHQWIRALCISVAGMRAWYIVQGMELCSVRIPVQCRWELGTVVYQNPNWNARFMVLIVGGAASRLLAWQHWFRRQRFLGGLVEPLTGGNAVN